MLPSFPAEPGVQAACREESHATYLVCLTGMNSRAQQAVVTRGPDEISSGWDDPRAIIIPKGLRDGRDRMLGFEIWPEAVFAGLESPLSKRQCRNYEVRRTRSLEFRDLESCVRFCSKRFNACLNSPAASARASVAESCYLRDALADQAVEIVG